MRRHGARFTSCVWTAWLSQAAAANRQADRAGRQLWVALAVGQLRRCWSAETAERHLRTRDTTRKRARKKAGASPQRLLAARRSGIRAVEPRNRRSAAVALHRWQLQLPLLPARLLRRQRALKREMAAGGCIYPLKSWPVVAKNENPNESRVLKHLMNTTPGIELTQNRAVNEPKKMSSNTAFITLYLSQGSFTQQPRASWTCAKGLHHNEAPHFSLKCSSPRSARCRRSGGARCPFACSKT